MGYDKKFLKVFKLIFRKFQSSNFIRNILLLSGSTTIIQLVNTILVPIITRLYSPEEFGIVTGYTSLLGILSIIGSLNYESGIVIADDDDTALSLIALCGMVLTIYVGIITFILVFFKGSFLNFVGIGELNQYRFLLSLGIFLTGLYNILLQWAYRKKDFRSIVKTRFSQSFSQNSIKIGLGFLKTGPIGLILGQILGQSLGITSLFLPILKFSKESLIKIEFKKIFWAARRYIRFPLYTTPSQFLNTAGTQLPVLFLTTLYGSKVVGFYGLALTVTNMPMRLIGKSIQDVFYSEAASIGRKNPRRLKNLSKKLFSKLVIVGLVPMIVLILFGPFLFSFVFGVDWVESGVYARLIAIMIFSRLIFLPTSVVFSVFEYQNRAFYLDVTRVALVLIVFASSHIFELSSYLTVGLYAITMSLIYFLTFIVAQKIMTNEVLNHSIEGK